MASPTRWTYDELAATVKAYQEMLTLEQNGQSYKKSAFNDALRQGPLSGRTSGSIEYRMQNISAVLEEMGLPRIKGYLPAVNVGENSKAEIKKAILETSLGNQLDIEPTADPIELEKREKKLRKLKSIPKPKGQKNVKQTTSTSTVYFRDPLVRAWVLEQAKGICEGCGQAAPFKLADDTPFLEVHHVKWLAQGGSDCVENTVALCPNCHRRCHLSADRTEFMETLYARIKRLIRE